MADNEIVTKREIGSFLTLVDEYVVEHTPMPERLQLAIELLKLQELRNIKNELTDVGLYLESISTQAEGHRF